MAVRVVASGIDSRISDGILDGTLVFTQVKAIRISASADIGTKIGHQTGDFVCLDIPKLKLTNPGGVENGTTRSDGNQSRGRGGVSAFFVVSTNDADSQAEAWFDRIEQAALADTALAGQYRLFSNEQTSEIFDVDIGLARR